MVKNKYQSLNRKEKKEAYQKYLQTNIGQNKKGVFLRLLIISILLFGYALYIVIDTIIKKETFWYYIWAGVIFFFGLVFLIGRHIILTKDINEYLVKKR